MKRTVYFIKGLHCPSCELLIEKRLKKTAGVNFADVSLTKNTLTLETIPGFKLTHKKLNEMFEVDGYSFSLNPFKHTTIIQDDTCPTPSNQPSTIISSIFYALLFILGYIFLSQTGFSSAISVNAQSSLIVFFFFGLLAGVSSCAALVGGIVLSVSKQWLSLYSPGDSFAKKAQPHLLFNAGRVLGYAFFGGMLGLIGNYFRLSPLVSASMVIGVSLLMILLGLQMLGIKSLQRFQIRLPKSLTGRLSDESNFTGKLAPLLMGALTFFLPCGFTITAQALALASGSPLTGSLIMGLFALGTVPGLLAIGLSSVKFYSNPRLASNFSMIAGLLVLFFAAFNINAQLSVLGITNINDLVGSQPTSQSTLNAGELPALVNGKQIIKINASASGYTPNRIVMRANTLTRWEITSNNISGCTNAIMSRGLFEGQIDLVDGTTSVKEFTSPKPGVYKFSCWMGMVTGTVEVVDTSGSTGAINNSDLSQSLPADRQGCGGGGGATCGGVR
ncbi:sulfite exporter TauE/SafE family protein [Candidatus Shapirobacteria bacterium]|nr:sulfite exporter TauE/SafE family protein [Candidatus Shapirobacteria bacterium]